MAKKKRVESAKVKQAKENIISALWWYSRAEGKRDEHLEKIVAAIDELVEIRAREIAKDEASTAIHNLINPD